VEGKMNSKGQNFYRTLMIIFITAIITLILSTVLFYNIVKNNPELKLSVNESNKIENVGEAIKSINKILEHYYLGDFPDEKTMVDGAVKGYVDSLNDEYTEYMTATDWQEYKENQLGNYIGFGVYLKSVDNGQQIVAIIKNSPAEKAELEVDDILIKVDDIVCTKDNGTEVTDYIKNEEVGKTINVDILRKGETISKQIKTEMVRIAQIESKMLEENVGYLQIVTFDMGCADDFKEKCNDLLKNGAKALIIDLRNNTGGVLSETISICELFLDKDDIILITRDKNNSKKIYKDKNKREIDVPIVLLTNNLSASASEVMAAALKDNNRTTIIGTKTYGKGVLQDVLSLSNGASLKITTHEFLRPNEEKIHKIGIEPDIELDIPVEYSNIIYVPEGEDNQLQKAIEVLQQ